MSENLPKETKEKIIKGLQAKGVKTICPMCGHNHFVLADGYFNNTLQKDLKNISLGGSGIPTISIVCSNCGFISQHALGVLGLLPDEAKENGNTK